MVEISAETIAAAEALFGVNYTAEERALILDNIEGQITSPQLRRNVSFPNTLPMASRFDPRLPGFVPPRQPMSGVWKLRVSV